MDRLIDRERQASLKDALGEESFTKILGDFRRNLTEQVGVISQSIAATDFSSVRAMTHCLRGAASNIGYKQISQAARELESAAIEGVNDVTPLFDKLILAIQAIHPDFTSPKE